MQVYALWNTVALLLLALTLPAYAKQSILTLDEVLNSSLRYVPQILESAEKKRRAEANQFAATGAFDTNFEQNSLFWLSGFYNGTYIDNSLVKPLQNSGGKVYGGYRSGTGTFPIYEDELITLNRGELNIGVLFPLFRDRNFDEKRFKLQNSELGIELARTELLLNQAQVQHGAMIAYWRWLAAGSRLSIYEHLLEIAEDRDHAFKERFAAGDIAEIDIVENLQNVLKRRALVVQTQGRFEVAALTLSLYFRDHNGEPRSPKRTQLPSQFPLIDTSVIQRVNEDIKNAFARQMELSRIDIEIEQAQLQLKLGENLFKPKVDIGAKLARDLGEGRASSEGTDIIVELAISVPIGRRAARGEISAAQARLNELKFERQQVQERLRTNITQLSYSLKATAEFADLASQEVTQATRLEQAERERGLEGASTFFLLNVREENAADTKVRNVIAKLTHFEALADYYAATANMSALRINTP
ncbi:MAG: TolC family protein [Gammaproteobacteria bacterium]|nr:TolC family protein [Gammaproteobacteria bacterium]